MANTFDPTNGNYTISTLDDFKAFRDAVNDGNSFAGETITLAADIDLNNEEWTPIGTSEKAFKGTFDGGNHTISNLKITGYNSNVGLFGFTTDGEIKNFTLTNADVSGRLNVGAVCGTPYTSKYTNITLNGDVQVKGMAYVGGMLGKNAYANLTDLTIDANDGSLVSANSVENGTAYRTYVGGVVGFMGEGGHKLTNITSNINVEGSTVDVGGIVGIAHYGNKLENVTCTAEKIVLTNADPTGEQEIGGIAGVWHNESGTTVTMTNCSVSDTLQLEVQVGGVKDDALTAAVQDNTLTGAPYSATGTGTLAIPLNSDYITTDVVVKGNQTLTADTANLAAVFELTGLKAGAAREIKLYFFEAGSTEGGIEVAVQVAEGVTSMPVYLTQFANGLYDVQVKDLSNLSRPVTEFDGVQLTNGTITVEKGGLDIDNLNIGKNSFVTVTGEAKLNIGSLSGDRLDVASGATLKDSYVGGDINMLGDMAIDGGLTLKGGLWASAGGTLSGDTLTATFAMFQKAAYTISADLELVHGYLSFGATFDVYSTIHTTGTNGEVLYINGDVNLKAGGKLKSDNSIFVCYDGASLVVEEGASIEANKFNVSVATATLTIAGTATAKDEVTNAGTITIMAATGELNAKSINGNVIIDAAGFTGTDKVLNLTASSMEGKVTFTNLDAATKIYYCNDGDIVLSTATLDTIYVSADWAGKEFGDDLGAGMAFGINSFETLAEAKAVLGAVGGTIELVTEAGSDKVLEGSVSFANGINTITGEAAIDWSKGWFFIGRGTGAENGATVIFDGATITSASDSASNGFHVSGEEAGSSEKKDGVLKVMNGSDVEVDYMINRGEIVVDNSKLTVKNGFGIAGRPASETPSGEKATATITLQNNATVIVNNENGMGIGTAASVQEGYGVLNVTESTLKYNAGAMNVSANGTVNLNDGATLDIAGGVANNGTINVTGDNVDVTAINNTGRVFVTGGELDTDKITGNGQLYVTGDAELSIDAIEGGTQRVRFGQGYDAEANQNTIPAGVTHNVTLNKADWDVAFFNMFGTDITMTDDVEIDINSLNSTIGNTTLATDGVMDINAKGNAWLVLEDDVTFEKGTFNVNGGWVTVQRGNKDDKADEKLIAEDASLNLTGRIDVYEDLTVDGTLKTAGANIGYKQYGFSDGATLKVTGEYEAKGNVNIYGYRNDDVANESGEEFCSGPTTGIIEASTLDVDGGKVTVTGNINNEGNLLLDDATLTAAAVKNSGKVVITGDSTVNTVISGGEILFGTADKAVDTTIDSDKVRGKVAIENGEVTFTGTNTNAIHPILVGSTMDNATWKHETAADAASAKLTIDDAATVNAVQVLVGNNDSVNQHSLDVKGSLILSSSIYAKASSNVTVDGYLKAHYFQAAGITTVKGAVEIYANAGDNALYISTDATAWDSIFTIENGGSVTITSGKNVLVGKEAGHTGKLVLDGTAALISNGAVTVGEGSSLELDYNSKLTFTDLLSAGTVSIDMNGYDNDTYKVFDATGSAAIDYSSLISGFDADLMKVVGNDLYITTQVNDVLYVNAAWADKAAGDIVDGGKIIGYNAFGKIGDVNSAIQSNTSRVEIAAGSYAASGYVDMEKDGTLDIEVTGTGAATLTSGHWCFGTNVYENAVVNVKGDFVAEKGMVWFLGDNKGTTINFSGSTTSAANTTFRGGNVTISEGSSITVDADASQWAQMMIYANVTCYGAISVDIVNPMGAAFLVGTNAYKNSMGYLYSVLTLSGENASLTANQANSDGNSTVDILIAGQGKMVVKNGASVNTDGYLKVAAQDADAKDADGNAYGGTLIVDGATLSASNMINQGSVTVTGDSKVVIDAMTGNAIKVLGGSLTDSKVKGDVIISGDETFKGDNIIDNTIVIGGTTTVDNGASLTGESVELTSGFEVTCLTAGAERDIYVNIIEVGADDGQSILVHVEEGATSAFAMTSILPDGTYDLTVIDGSNIYKRLNVEISGGAFSMNGGVLDVTTFTGSFDVAGKSTVQIDNYTRGTMSVAAGSTLVDTKVAGAGTVAFAADSVTYFEGENEITAAINGATTNFDLMVNEGASLLITRYVLGYGRDITVKGLLTDATAMENADGQILSLKANSTSGFSINGWGSSVLDVTDAYVDLADSSIKGDASTVGTYTWNFKNSYVKAASFGNCNDTTGTGSWTITLDDSKLVASNYIKNGVGVTTTFQNGSVATTGSMRIEGTLNIDATSSVVVTAYQNNKRGAQDEHGDFSGTLNLAGTLDITGSKLGVELYGATFNVKGGTLKLNNEDLILDAASKLNLTVGGNVTTAGSIVNGGTINMDAASTITAKALEGTGAINITFDPAGLSESLYKVIEITGSGDLNTDMITVNGAAYNEGTKFGDYSVYEYGNDLYLYKGDLYTLHVSDEWADKPFGTLTGDGGIVGINAFDLDTVFAKYGSNATSNDTVAAIHFDGDAKTTGTTNKFYTDKDVAWTADQAVVIDTTSSGRLYLMDTTVAEGTKPADADLSDIAEITIGKNVTLKGNLINLGQALDSNDVDAEGNATRDGAAITLTAQAGAVINAKRFQVNTGSTLNIEKGAKVQMIENGEATIVRAGGTINVTGNGKDELQWAYGSNNYLSMQGGTLNMTDTWMQTGTTTLSADTKNAVETSTGSVINMKNSKLDAGKITINAGSTIIADGSVIMSSKKELVNDGTLVFTGAESTLSAGTKITGKGMLQVADGEYTTTDTITTGTLAVGGTNSTVGIAASETGAVMNVLHDFTATQYYGDKSVWVGYNNDAEFDAANRGKFILNIANGVDFNAGYAMHIANSGVVNVSEDADVYGGYVKVRGDLNVTDATLEATTMNVYGEELYKDGDTSKDRVTGNAAATFTDATLTVTRALTIGKELNSAGKDVGRHGSVSLTNSKATIAKLTINQESVLKLDDSTVTVNGDMFLKGAVEMDYTSTLTVNGLLTVSGWSYPCNYRTPSIKVDTTGYTGGTYKVIDTNGIAGPWFTSGQYLMRFNDDLYVTQETNDVLYVNAAWAAEEVGNVLADGKIVGYNAFGDIQSAVDGKGNVVKQIIVQSDTVSSYTEIKKAEIVSGVAGGVTLDNTYGSYVYVNDLTVGQGVTMNVAYLAVSGKQGGAVDLNGAINASGIFYIYNDGSVNVGVGGKLTAKGGSNIRRNANGDVVSLSITGNGDGTVQLKEESYLGFYSGKVVAKDTAIELGALNMKAYDSHYQNKTYAGFGDAKAIFDLDNTTLTVTNLTELDGQASLILKNGSSFSTKNMVNAGSITITDSAFTATGTVDNGTVLLLELADGLNLKDTSALRGKMTVEVIGISSSGKKTTILSKSGMDILLTDCPWIRVQSTTSYSSYIYRITGPNGEVLAKGAEADGFAAISSDNVFTGSIKVQGESTLNIGTLTGEELWLEDGAIIKNSTVGGNAFVAGNVTFRGDNKFNMIYDFGELTGYYGTSANMEWTVEKGASLYLTQTSERYGLGYGDNVKIYGELVDARSVRDSLTKDDLSFSVNGISMMNGGWSNESNFFVKDAYVEIGRNSSFGNQNQNKGGKYTVTFENSVLDSTRITLHDAGSDVHFTFTNSDALLSGVLSNASTGSTIKLNNSKLVASGSNGTDYYNQNAGTMVVENGSELRYVAKFTNSGTLTINGSNFYGSDVVNTGTITIDANSLLTADTLDLIGTIVVDYTGYTGGTKKLVDLSGTSALDWTKVIDQAPGTNGGSLLFLKDGDIIITDQDLATVYVNADWAGLEYGTVLDDGKVIGLNAFADTKNAFTDAESHTTFVIADNVAAGFGAAYDLKINDDYVYTITGGGDSYQKLNPIFMQDADANAELIISDAKFTIGKLIAGSSANANTNTSSITVKDSYLKAADYTGGAAWWTMWGNTTTTIENSVIGLKDTSALDITAISKGAAGANVDQIAWYGQDNVMHFGSAGTVTITDSTMLTGFFQVADRGITTLDNALIYVGGSLNVGYTGSGTASWSGLSADTYNVDGVATLTVGNGSYIKNINWGGSEGVLPNENIGMNVGGGKAGAVIVTEGSTIAMEVNDVNNHSDGINIYSNGTLTVEDGSAVIGRELSNAGTITVDDATLKAVSFTNTGKVAITGNSAVSDIANNGGTVYLYGFTGDLMNITGNGNIQLGKDIAGAETATDLVINSAWNAGTNTVTVNSASSLTVNAAMNAGKLNIWGEFVMDYESSITFSDTITVQSTGSFLLDLEGYVGNGTNVLLIDDVNNSWTVDQYKALLGNVWNDKAFSVVNGDLYLSGSFAPAVYVNTAWDETTCPSDLVWGVNAFNTVANAVANGAETIEVLGGSTLAGGTDPAASETTHAFQGVDTTIQAGTTATDMILGGYRVAVASKTWFESEGDMNLTINGGTFSRNVIGGSALVSGSTEHVGDINLTINGGTFNRQVAGGMYHAAEGRFDMTALTGDVNFVITGGTFNARVYGGNFSYDDDQYARMSSIQGDVNLTIDSSANMIKFAGDVVAGSRHEGVIDGNVNVTVTGLGSNLTFKDDGYLWGGSSADHYFNTTSGKVTESHVTGNRNLTFSDFTGDFNGKVMMFNTVTVEDGSAVNFTNSGLDLEAVADWTFEYGSSMSGVAKNDFAGDKLTFDLAGFEADADGVWEMFSGSVAGFEDAKTVILGGEIADWNSTSNSWKSASYELSTNDDEDKLIISKLA